ncbi:hypothetical protein J4455_02680 [Candidatus Woesearchaeota archaeon]|nr:hypothetical protein [Candidatus Woesearchaeota archaeon]
MVTTIQINEKTLKVLKKIKDETRSSSYDEAINKLVSHQNSESLAGFLGKRPIKELLKDLRDKNGRF